MSLINIGNALIATHNLADYAGSEIFTLELAITLRDMGWRVTVATFFPGLPMLLEFKKHGFSIVNLLTDDFSSHHVKYDLAWIHHTPVFHELLLVKKIEAAKTIFCSLSHFEPLEAPPSDIRCVDLLLAHSVENKNRIKQDYKLKDDQIIVFPNSVPKQYWRFSRCFNSFKLVRLAVVSNHPPAEVLKAIKILQDKSIVVEHIGLNGIKRLVSPELLLEYDAIVTIGKTVLYSFALNIPIYCYDHFGGPGWLTDENFDLAGKNNFSGRGFKDKTSENIAYEIINGYEDSLLKLAKFRTHAADFHDLEKNLLRLFAHPNVVQSKHRCLAEDTNLLRQHGLYIRLAKTLSVRETELAIYIKEIHRIKNTFSWRIAAPFRVIYNFLLRISGRN